VKYTRILAALLGVVTLLTTSCGVGDKIGSVSISAVGLSGGVVDLKGIGGTIQLKVTANYTSGKQIDETNFVTYTVTPERDDDTGALLPSPPQTVTINNTGMVTAVEPAKCTWKNLGTVQSPSWVLTGDYVVTAKYRGFTSQPIFIPVASAASSGNNTNGQCGPA
jgi:hypothetical protein